MSPALEVSHRRRQLLIPGGLTLAEAERLVTDYPGELSADDTAFIKASRRNANRAFTATAAAAIVFAVIATLAITASWYAWQQRDEANRQAQVAKTQQEIAETQTEQASRERNRALSAETLAAQQRDEAERQKFIAEKQAGQARKAEEETRRQLWESHRSESISLAERSRRELEAGDARKAISTALKGLPGDLDHPDRPFLAAPYVSLMRAWIADRLSANIHLNDNINDAKFSPDGRFLVTSSRDGFVSQWNPESGELNQQSPADRFAAYSSIYSQNGKLIATAYQRPLSVVIREVSTDLQNHHDY